MRRGMGPAGRGGGRRRTRRRMYRRSRRRMRRRMVIGGMVILGAGYGVYKLTQPQVDQIEQHTGQKAENLSEEQLEAAMDELGIEAQDPTDAEIAALEAEDAKNPSYPEASAPATAAAPQADDSYLHEIEKLAELRDKGIITDEEFEAKKKNLLDL